MTDKTQFATVTIRRATLNRVKGHLLELAIAEFEKKGALAIWTDRPSVSAFVESAIKEKLDKLESDRMVVHETLATIPQVRGGRDVK